MLCMICMKEYDENIYLYYVYFISCKAHEIEF